MQTFNKTMSTSVAVQKCDEYEFSSTTEIVLEPFYGKRIYLRDKYNFKDSIVYNDYENFIKKLFMLVFFTAIVIIIFFPFSELKSQ